MSGDKRGWMENMASGEEPTDWLLHVEPGRRLTKDETLSPAQLLRDSGMAHYGCGVTVRRSGLGFQVFGGAHSRMIATCTNLDQADLVARALVGQSFVMLETAPAWRCPKCGESKTLVTDSRPQSYDVYRRRKCEACDARWSTSERMVVRRNR